MKKILLFSFLVTVIATILLLPRLKHQKVELSPAPSLDQLNSSIQKAQSYYEGLYTDLGIGAVVVEYYGPKVPVYTIRHATIIGEHYYEYVGETDKANRLKIAVTKTKFDEDTDPHALLWMDKNTVKEGYFYTTGSYFCNIYPPIFKKALPYHSKVCKLGTPGVWIFTVLSRFDTFVPMAETLKHLQDGKKVDLKPFEDKYNGFGMPMCTPFSCSKTASAFRTAYFGELELRTNNMKYADSVASNLLKAQNDKGAIYISYDKDGNLKEDKSFAYKALDRFLGDKVTFNGFVPTNSETMGDVLAFLLHYRCQKYDVCVQK